MEAGDATDFTDVIEWYGIENSEKKVDSILRYLDLLALRRDWAGLASRSCARNPACAALDSLGVLDVLPFAHECAVADIGSGGGLLGLVLAIVCKSWKMTLVETSSKKCAFLAEAAGKLDLDNVRVENARGESLEGTLAFDAVLSRAAGALDRVAPVALGLLERAGKYVALKGSEPGDEVAKAVPAIEMAGGKLLGVRVPLHMEALKMPVRATLVVIEKM